MISGIQRAPYAKITEAIQTSTIQTISGIVQRVSKVAIPAILLFVASNLQGASAGPLAYASCMAGCAAMPPVCAAGGWAACLVALSAPTP